MSGLAEKLAQGPDRRKQSKKILVIDIERLPGLAEVWDQKTRFIPVSKFHTMPSLLCWAAKWYGHSKVEFEAVWDDPERMVARIWELYDQADAIVTFNGVRFDDKHLRSEWITNGYPPPAPWKPIDLYQVNSRLFGFESKSLNHLCWRLGLDTKDGHYDSVLAHQAVDGDVKAQRLMKRYNVGDVRITEQAYVAMLPWLYNHPHPTSGNSTDRVTCPNCWGDNLTRNGTKLAQQITYVLYRCQDCHANVQGTRHSRAAISRYAR